MPAASTTLTSASPGDLAVKVKGTVVTLPVNGSQVTVRSSDKVIVSLRTKDPNLAKARVSKAEQALSRHRESPPSRPVPLTHLQLVALAGDCYRANVEAFEADPDIRSPVDLVAFRQPPGP